jgi:hypothetical protein
MASSSSLSGHIVDIVKDDEEEDLKKITDLNQAEHSAKEKVVCKNCGWDCKKLINNVACCYECLLGISMIIKDSMTFNRDYCLIMSHRSYMDLKHHAIRHNPHSRTNHQTRQNYWQKTIDLIYPPGKHKEQDRLRSLMLEKLRSTGALTEEHSIIHQRNSISNDEESVKRSKRKHLIHI